MYNCAAIKEVTHTNEKHWYFPLRAIFIFWTGSLQQHDISRAPGHMVPQPSLPGVLVARETVKVQGRPKVGGQALGVGYLGEVLSCPVCLYHSNLSICTLHVTCTVLSDRVSCVLHQ